ncbi:hypothetical protein A0H81_14983 [Grifola frondosa]|uniref:Uncharacterized protein n=1 Tax=Grifola frondosa TaxID=5627 RepID=A0A1C7LJN7_GRIFR|nr:hypothetical protein A0H81_14983 [Grifola frondosa]
MPESEVAEQDQKARREERKRNLHVRRLEAAAEYSDLRRHVNMLMELGTSGTSSDESDNENGVVEYSVLVKPWRNPLLADWIRVFDAAYRTLRLSSGNKSTRSAHPHLRVESQKESSSRAPTGLPINAYSRRWLETLSDFDMEALSPQPSKYDFTHTPAVMK